MANIKIHASSLSVHFQNMRNINGVLDDVNSLRHAVKALISTVNHNANVTAGENRSTIKIEGIDVEKKDGAISIVAAYDAFDRTRQLLLDEVVSLADIANKHLYEVNCLRNDTLASSLNGQFKKDIIECIDRYIVPRVKQAESAGIVLRSEVGELPAAVRDVDGKLVFENGQIKHHDVEFRSQ
ncbi:hypothetical protein [Maridesulfovibrio sp.]|uniref:hypothetical protein n=1 Tax=Maridesulfovibrio sp. TaxID=2795000 RepID=UPI0029CAA9B6|nr:hypothetical protein [Maridesulfovibrio sp.]